jgi:hypothetical protein
VTTRNLTHSQQSASLPHRNLPLRRGIETARMDVPGAPRVFTSVVLHGEPIGNTQVLAPDLEDLNRLLFRYQIPHTRELARIQYAIDKLGLGIGSSPGLPKGRVILIGEAAMAVLDLATEAMQVSPLPFWVGEAFRRPPARAADPRKP